MRRKVAQIIGALDRWHIGTFGTLATWQVGNWHIARPPCWYVEGGGPGGGRAPGLGRPDAYGRVLRVAG